jgi:hypothetical protein
MDQRDEKVSAEMVAEHHCPVCGERATLHCAGCGRVFCAEHIQRGFALGYTFLCATCAGSDTSTDAAVNSGSDIDADADTGAADTGAGAR